MRGGGERPGSVTPSPAQVRLEIVPENYFFKAKIPLFALDASLYSGYKD